MIKKIALAVAVVVAGILIYAATKPDTFVIQRSMSIKAPPDKIFPLISDLHAWASWSPWEKMDPTMKRTHSGAAKGQGAVYEWEGNSKVGAGRMEITETSAPSKVILQLDFLKPFKATNMTEFTLAADAGSTNVNWAMTGHSPYLSKVMCVFMNMDKMVGKDFESGLYNLKALAEK